MNLSSKSKKLHSVTTLFLLERLFFDRFINLEKKFSWFQIFKLTKP